MPKKSAPKASALRSDSDVPNGPATRVLRLFRVVFNAVKAHFRQVEASAGVAGAQVWALSVIAEHPGIGVRGVAHAMDIHQSTASNLLKPLIERGMVAADREGADRRAVHLHLSAKGAAILRTVPGPFAGVLPEALGAMDEPTLKRLGRDLTTLCHLLGVEARGPGMPLGQPGGADARQSKEPAKVARARFATAAARRSTSAPASTARKASKTARHASRG